MMAVINDFSAAGSHESQRTSFRNGQCNIIKTSILTSMALMIIMNTEPYRATLIILQKIETGAYSVVQESN